MHQAPLDPRDVTVCEGFRTTTIERTIVDLGATIGRRQLLLCLLEALESGRTSIELVEATCRRVARPGRAGSASVRWAIATAERRIGLDQRRGTMFERDLAEAAARRSAGSRASG